MVSGKYVYQITVFSKDEKWLYYSKEATKVSVKVDTIGDRNLIKEFSNIIFFSERNISNLLFNTGETLKDIIDEKQWTEIAVNEATDIFNELIIDKSITTRSINYLSADNLPFRAKVSLRLAIAFAVRKTLNLNLPAVFDEPFAVGAGETQNFKSFLNKQSCQQILLVKGYGLDQDYTADYKLKPMD